MTVADEPLSLTSGAAEAQVLDAVVVGAGLGGIYQLYRLRRDGLAVRSFEAADGVGGVWYLGIVTHSCDTKTRFLINWSQKISILMKSRTHRPKSMLKI